MKFKRKLVIGLVIILLLGFLVGCLNFNDVNVFKGEKIDSNIMKIDFWVFLGGINGEIV